MCAIEFTLSAHDVRRGSLNCGLIVPFRGFESSIICGSNMNRNIRQTDLPRCFDPMASAGHYETLPVNDLGFDPMVDAVWREEVVVGVANCACSGVWAVAHGAELFGAYALAKLSVDGRHLRHVRAHLFRARLR
ncbi:hypothetical protein [Dermacoccus abyssi]|uniref:hypothetical protein n=1 Tax=Dermacoccus abyssi TaxID=322596 RepID=UPI002AD23C7C|nr:hypothetical protein [Dermacoccus abyssi]